MALSLKKQTIVILANSHNPSIFREKWLEAHGIFSSEELGELTYASQFCQVQGPISLFVVPDRLQLLAAGEADAADMATKATVIVDALGETPYYAVGFNFDWSYESDEASLKELAEKKFAPPAASLIGDATFGTVAVSTIGSARRTVNIRPAGEALSIGLNYHYDLDVADSKASALAAISQWPSNAENASDLVQALFR